MRRLLSSSTGHVLTTMSAAASAKRFPPAAFVHSVAAGRGSSTTAMLQTRRPARDGKFSSAHVLAAYHSTTDTISQRQDTTAEDKTRHQAKTQRVHTPLPFYSLFPKTLPAGAPPTGRFDIDLRALRTEFLRLQAANHPDHHYSAAASSSSSSSSVAPADAGGNSREYSGSHWRKAESLSGLINAAYRTLSSPLQRAQYILAERYGIDLAGDEAGTRGDVATDPVLLADVLRAYESIDDARSNDDLAELAAENRRRVQQCLADLARLFGQEDVQGALAQTIRLKYWDGIEESIKNWEEKSLSQDLPPS